MKKGHRTVTLFAHLFVAAVLCCAGCATFSRTPPPQPSATLQTVTDDYRQALRQASATEQALDALEVTGVVDLRQALDYFTANEELMEQIGVRLTAHADGMFYRGTYYFVEAGKSLEACALPRAAQADERRTVDLGPEFYLVSDAGEEVKYAWRDYQFDIEQIRYLVSNDPRPIGIDTTEQLYRMAKVDIVSLKDALRKALASLDQASRKLAQPPNLRNG